MLGIVGTTLALVRASVAEARNEHDFRLLKAVSAECIEAADEAAEQQRRAEVAEDQGRRKSMAHCTSAIWPGPPAETQRLLYLAQMNQAYRAWHDGDFPTLRALIEPRGPGQARSTRAALNGTSCTASQNRKPWC